MALTAAGIERILTLAAMVFAYFFSMTMNGYLQARIALWLGDNTPETAGYLSLNPLAHFNVFGFIGFASMLLHGIGWIQSMPVDPHAVHGKHRNVKLALLFGSGVFIPLITAIFAFIGLVLTLDVHQFELVQRMFHSIVVPINELGARYPTTSSFSLVIALFLMALVFFNVFITALNVVFNGFWYVIAVGFDNGYSYAKHADFLGLIVPLLLIIFFGDFLRYVLLYGIKYVAYLVGAF